MSIAMSAWALIAAGVCCIFVVIFREVLRRDRFADLDLEWLSEFSVAKYKPMERLLSEDDYSFLAAQEGYDPSIASRLRSERRKIFRQYLRCLRRDFARLEGAVRLLMVNSAKDRPDLAKALLRQRLLFTCGIVAAEFRLGLHSLGWGTVDIRGLLGALDAMHARLGQLATAGARA